MNLCLIAKRDVQKVPVTRLSGFERDLIALPPDKIAAIQKILNMQVRG